MKESPMLPPLEERRERVFLILAGIFLCAMTMLNIIGITRFVNRPMSLAVGVLPYPITFLVTDLISERLYGQARANFLVWVGLGLNPFVLGNPLARTRPFLPSGRKPCPLGSNCA